MTLIQSFDTCDVHYEKDKEVQNWLRPDGHLWQKDECVQIEGCGARNNESHFEIWPDIENSLF